MTSRQQWTLERVPTIILGHANPDFDAYASMLAATRLFEGARAVYFGSQNANVREFHNLHEDFLHFIDPRRLDPSSVERVVIVDTRDISRLGEGREYAEQEGVEVVVYDHHARQPGDLVGIDDRSMSVGATTSILAHELHARGVALTPLEATALLLGIHEDTGSLTYPGTTPFDAEAAAFLMASGADLDVLNHFLVRALTPQQRALLDELLETLEVWSIHGREVAVASAHADGYVESASIVTHHLCEDLGYRVAIVVIEMPERLQVVGRSRAADVDVAAVLRHVGGGGHSQAASAAIREADLADVLGRLRSALEAEVPPPVTAADIASTPVRSVTPATTMAEAGHIMARWGHGGLTVLEEGRLVGLVTRKDVDKAVRHGLDHAPVTGFMARDPVTVRPDTRVDELERLLVRTGIGRLPVVEEGELVGIVTRKDLLRAQHGESYLDRRMSRQRTGASRTFLASLALLPDEVQDAVRTIGRVADEAGLRAHAVGGFVRDMLLGRENLDLDVVIEGDGLEFALGVGERLGKRVKVHRRFGTAVLVWSKEFHIDITSARTEYYQRPGALPTVERSSLRQDLFRRDFSINAMAVSINPASFGQIADPFGGLYDLERGVVRTLHSLSFVEDPTRVLRAARFEKRFGFRIDAPSEELLRQAVEMGMLDEVGGARMREELLDIIDEDDPGPILARLADLGVLSTLAPDGADHARLIGEVDACAASFPAASTLFDSAPRRRTTLVAAMVACSARPAVDRWCRWLHFGREYSEPALIVAERSEALLVRLKNRRRMRPSRLYYLLEALPAEVLVYLWSVGEVTVRTRIEEFATVLSPIRSAVSGEDLTALGLTPGPVYSGILAQARADRLDGVAVGREAELMNLKRLARRARH